MEGTNWITQMPMFQTLPRSRLLQKKPEHIPPPNPWKALQVYITISDVFTFAYNFIYT